MIAIEKACAVKALQRHEEGIMHRNFQTLIREESKSPGEFKSDIRKLKEKMEVLDQERYHGALIRARAEKFAVGKFRQKRRWAWKTLCTKEHNQRNRKGWKDYEGANRY
ncbi:unnamed protein product [Ixodes pacificus]